MSDLVERLRASATQARAIDRAALLHEAADEIERLRLTNEEREAISVAMHRCDTPHYRTIRSLLERTK